VGDYICDVPVHEDLTGDQSNDLVGGHPAVGATDPEVGRTLLSREILEEVGVIEAHPLGPSPIVFEQVFQNAHLVSRNFEGGDSSVYHPQGASTASLRRGFFVGILRAPGG
jgi:hypothetical protein